MVAHPSSRPSASPSASADPLLAALAACLAWASSPGGAAAVARVSSSASSSAVGAWLDRGGGGSAWAHAVGALTAPANVGGAERLFRAYAGETVDAYFAGLRRDRRAARERGRASVCGGGGAAAASADDSPLAGAGETPPRGLSLNGAGGASATPSPAHLPRAPSPDDLSWASELARVARDPDARSLTLSIVASASSASAAAACAAVARGARAALAPVEGKARAVVASREALLSVTVAIVAMLLMAVAAVRAVVR